MKKLIVIGIILGMCMPIYAYTKKSEKTSDIAVETSQKEDLKSKSNDLVLREYEDDTMTISDNTEVDLKKLKSDTSIQKLVLYNCTTKDKTDITDKDDFFCDILPGTYKVYAYYNNDEMVNVTNQVECSTYFEAGSSDITG